MEDSRECPPIEPRLLQWLTAACHPERRLFPANANNREMWYREGQRQVLDLMQRIITQQEEGRSITEHVRRRQ